AAGGGGDGESGAGWGGGVARLARVMEVPAVPGGAHPADVPLTAIGASETVAGTTTGDRTRSRGAARRTFLRFGLRGLVGIDRHLAPLTVAEDKPGSPVRSPDAPLRPAPDNVGVHGLLRFMQPAGTDRPARGVEDRDRALVDEPRVAQIRADHPSGGLRELTID